MYSSAFIAGRNINNLRYADETILMAESEEGQKRFLMRVREESEKAGLKLSIQKTKIMASSPITLWHIGEKWKWWQTTIKQSYCCFSVVNAWITVNKYEFVFTLSFTFDI